MKRIVVIDDDPGVTSLLKRSFSYEGYAVSTANTGEIGLNQVRDQLPDLVILDVMMPGLDGYEVLRRLRAAEDRVAVIMLTAKDTTPDQVRGLESGADDYVVKPFSFELLLARVHALLRRHQDDHPVVLRYADLSLDLSGHTVHRTRRRVELTRLEYKLLEELLNKQGRVRSQEELLDRVWGEKFFGAANVVEVFVKNLRQKLEAGGEPRLIQTVRGAGYVLRLE